MEASHHLIRIRKLSDGRCAKCKTCYPNNTYDIKRYRLSSTFQETTISSTWSILLTLNDAQGQFLARTGMDLPCSVFEHGHLYIGFSRFGNPDKLFVFADKKEYENLKKYFKEGKVYIRNIVYSEIFGQLCM